MIIIGLTGSIAMGKTVVAEQFSSLDIPVFDADKGVHDLLENDADVIEEVCAIFSEIKEAGKINRQLLGKIVFEDDEKMHKLEAIIHPAIREKELAFIRSEKEKGAPLVVLEIPLLFETDADEICDHIVVVTAPYEDQKERVMKRSDMTEEKFASIMSKQMPDEEKQKRADFIIQTELGRDYSMKQVKQIVDILRAKK